MYRHWMDNPGPATWTSSSSHQVDNQLEPELYWRLSRRSTGAWRFVHDVPGARNRSRFAGLWWDGRHRWGVLWYGSKRTRGECDRYLGSMLYPIRGVKEFTAATTTCEYDAVVLQIARCYSDPMDYTSLLFASQTDFDQRNTLDVTRRDCVVHRHLMGIHTPLCEM